jgi:hypothetical protein
MKKNILKTGLACLAFVALSGCATPYGPNGFAGGYSSVRIQNDIFRVVFNGNGFIHQSAVQHGALVRAAELTVQSGRNYFHVINGDTDIRKINVFIPGQTFVNNNTTGYGYAHATAYPIGNGMYAANAYGTYNANTSATAFSTPSYSGTIQKPIVTLDIQTLSGRVEPCLDARQVLQGALEYKVKLEPATLARLNF